METVELAVPEDAGDLRIAVVVAEFNPTVTDGLLAGALESLDKAGCREATVVRVPGSFELPLAARRLAATHDAVIALGAVIKGETDHYDYICEAATRGLMDAALAAGVPVAFGVLTAREPEHAIARSGAGPGNKGVEAAEAAVAAALTMRALDG